MHANGIRFHVVEGESSQPDDPTEGESSQPDRPLVILLHGFGSFWWSWRHQLAGLTGARVVAVDLRGYGDTDKPPRGYDGWTLAGDTAGLGSRAGTQISHARRARRRRPGVLGDGCAAPARGRRDRPCQLTASGGAAGLHPDPS